MKKYKIVNKGRFTIAVAVLLIITAILGILITGCKNEVSESEFNKIINNEKALKEVHYRNVNAVYKDIHEMANTVIIADQIWGKEEITKERLNALIIEVTASNYESRKHLLDILNGWKNGDFSNVVNDHNYVWEKLGGTVGKAILPNDEKIIELQLILKGEI